MEQHVWAVFVVGRTSCILSLDDVLLLFLDRGYYNIYFISRWNNMTVMAKPGGIVACREHGARRPHQAVNLGDRENEVDYSKFQWRKQSESNTRERIPKAQRDGCTIQVL